MTLEQIKKALGERVCIICNRPLSVCRADK
jgi:hypothetical protein